MTAEKIAQKLIAAENFQFFFYKAVFRFPEIDMFELARAMCRAGAIRPIIEKFASLAKFVPGRHRVGLILTPDFLKTLQIKPTTVQAGLF